MLPPRRTVRTVRTVAPKAPPSSFVSPSLDANPPNHPTVLLSESRERQAGHRGSALMVTSSHSERALTVEAEPWQIVRPPKRGQDRTAFHAFMLLPGLSLAFYAGVLGRSRSSIAAYRAAAIEAAQLDPAIIDAVNAAVWAMRAEHGLRMARLRGKAQLPSWSRLAIGEYRKRGFSRREIAAAFRCSPGTVANVLQGKGSAYALFSGERRLTQAQRNPPGRWVAGAQSRSSASWRVGDRPSTSIEPTSGSRADSNSVRRRERRQCCSGAHNLPPVRGRSSGSLAPRTFS